MFGLVASNVRIHVERFQIVAIVDTSDSVFCVSSAVGLQGGLIKQILIFCIRHGSGVWFLVLYILFDLLSVQLSLLSFFFQLSFTNSISDVSVLIISLGPLLCCIGRS
jgi:hypothetical protein